MTAADDRKTVRWFIAAIGIPIALFFLVLVVIEVWP